MSTKHLGVVWICFACCRRCCRYRRCYRRCCCRGGRDDFVCLNGHLGCRLENDKTPNDHHSTIFQHCCPPSNTTANRCVGSGAKDVVLPVRGKSHGGSHHPWSVGVQMKGWYSEHNNTTTQEHNNTRTQQHNSTTTQQHSNKESKTTMELVG